MDISPMYGDTVYFHYRANTRCAHVMCALLFLVISATDSNAADVRIDGNVIKGYCEILVTGEIDVVTPQQVKHVISSSSDKDCPAGRIFRFDSPGGDLDSAMTIGNEIRRADAFTVIWQQDTCASACVIAFVGGVNRLVFGKIGLHRPYVAGTPGSAAEMHSERLAMDSSIERYLKNMSISPQLLSDMNAVSPDAIRWLDGANDDTELKQLQLIGEDVGFADRTDAAMAKKLGITMSEYYARQHKVNAECSFGDYSNAALAEYNKCFNRIIEGGQ